MPRVLLAVLLAVAVLGAGARAAHAAWAPATRSADVNMAVVASAFQLASGGGSVSTDGRTYTIGSVLAGGTGYVDLVNTSTVPAGLALKLSLTAVLGSSPASVCSVAWNTVAATCPGTSTVVGISTGLGTTSGAYSTTGAVQPGAHVFLKVTIGGVAGGVTVTTDTVTPRGATDRSLA